MLGPHTWNLYTLNEVMRLFVIEVVDRCVLKSVYNVVKLDFLFFMYISFLSSPGVTSSYIVKGNRFYIEMIKKQHEDHSASAL